MKLLRRAWRLVRMVAGMAVATGRYLWAWAFGDMPIHRQSERLPSPPPDEPGEGDVTERQPRSAGVGPVYDRTFRVRIRSASIDPEELVTRVATHLNVVSPVEVASFEKQGSETEGGGTPGGKTEPREEGLRRGDRYVVKLPGPWNAPVTVVEREPERFRLATRRGHLEAGEIEFTSRREGADLVFEIHSVARAGDWLFRLLYDRFWIGREMQLHMWSHFCRRVVDVSGGEHVGGIDVTTKVYSRS